jgi:Raf kinase inhibitor-like YbhB/YbcL family protein
VNDPFARMPEVYRFEVTSSDVDDGHPFRLPQMSGVFGVKGGADISPQLKWSGAPQGTGSYAVTIYDPDAPTGAGFWHWAVANIPGSTSGLPTGAGDEGGAALPSGSFQLPNDARLARYLGAAPPPGHGMHRYFIVVHALDIENIAVPPEATPSFLGFNIMPHTLGRAVLVATAEQ